MERDNGRRLLSATAGAPDVASALRAGCLAWVRLAADPTVQRILLLDAPSVLGWTRWRELEERYGLGLLKRSLRGAAQSGLLPPDMVEIMAHVWLAAFNEVALYIARADDTVAAMHEAESMVDRLVERLLDT